jgi:hypothetical protein
MTRRSLLGIVCGLSVIGLSGCGGSNGSTNDIPSDLYGTWVLTDVRGGTPGDSTSGLTETLTLRVKNTASIQDNNNPVVNGTFTAEVKVTDIESKPLVVLTLPGGIERAIIDETTTMLTLAEVNTSNRHFFDYTRPVP